MITACGLESVLHHELALGETSRGGNSLSLANRLHLEKKADIATQGMCPRRGLNHGFQSEVEGDFPARGE